MATPPEMLCARSPDHALIVRFAGEWRLGGDLPAADIIDREIASDPSIRSVTLEAQGVSAWDTGFVTFLRKVMERCAQRQVTVDAGGLPSGARRLIALASSVPEQAAGRSELGSQPLLAHVGLTCLKLWRDTRDILAFIGEIALSLVRLVRGKARFQGSDLVFFVQQAGVEALPIVSLISVLVGLILGFVGAVQLRLFGAEAYVADLVGIGMIREMGAMMTGIIMAGRTGAAYAAQLGTMQVNEEIDAFRTFGIDPVDFLVLPRVLALVVMLPLLCAYADLMGVLGGSIVAVGSFDMSLVQYLQRAKEAVPLSHFWLGLIKSAIYGVVVATSGCLRGMQCGRSASAVGEATTSAVVTAIVGIIVWCALTTVIFHVLGV